MTFPTGFLRVCSIHLHFLLAIFQAVGSYLAHAHRSLFLIFCGHQNSDLQDVLQAAVNGDLQLVG